MHWLSLVIAGAVGLGAAGLGSMKAALDRGDVDEASRQGVLAGPATVEAALASRDRTTVLAGIAAAPAVEDRVELLDALAQVAAGPDRRTAIPAARAAVAIARELAHRAAGGRVHEAEGALDDLADADLVTWRDRWATIALDRARWIEVRVLAVDTAGQLDVARAPYRAASDPRPAIAATAPAATAPPPAPTAPSPAPTAPSPAPAAPSPSALALETFGAGVPVATALADPDPALRVAVLAQLPMPLPAALREPLATAVVHDRDPQVALAASAALCADLAFDPPAPIVSALGPGGIARLQAIVVTDGAPPGALRAAARCLAADTSPASAAALRAIRGRLRDR